MSTNSTNYKYCPTRFSEEFIKAIPGDALHLLHIGCGDGQRIAALCTADTRRKIYGVDRDAEFCQKAAASLDQVFQLDIQNESPPLTPGSMDCILMDGILEHMACPEVVLLRLSNLLKPQGCIVAQVTCSAFGSSTSYRWHNTEDAPEQSVCKVTWRYSSDYLRTVFAHAGLKIEVLHRVQLSYCESVQLIIRAQFSNQIIY